MTHLPFPEFMHSVFDRGIPLTATKNRNGSVTWLIETGMPFSLTLTSFHCGNHPLGWLVHEVLASKEHVESWDVISLEELLRAYRTNCQLVLRDNPEQKIPEPWKSLLIEHELLEIETVTHERYHLR